MKASHAITHCLLDVCSCKIVQTFLPCHFCAAAACLSVCLLLQMTRPSKILSSTRSQTLLTPYLSHMVSQTQAAAVSACTSAST